jgi:hypothetical protein
MSKFKVQMKFKFRISNCKYFDIWTLVIDLTFACLPLSADRQAQAGILTFGFN